MKRPTKFENVVGQNKVIKFITERIKYNAFPQRTIFYGEEGTGKTTLMFLTAMTLTCEQGGSTPCGQCKSCRDNIEFLIGKGQSTNNVKVLRMSVEGGKEAAQESLEHLTTAFTNGVKVVIYEECHRMDDKAQDVLLSPIEFLPKGVYVMFATTDILRINKALLSRLVQLGIHKPNRKELVNLLKETATENKIQIESPAILDMIATWADMKPRAALALLETLGATGKVEYEEAESFMNFISTKDVLPIVKNLKGSILQGLVSIQQLQLSKDSQGQLCDLLVEIIKLKRTGKSTRLTQEDIASINEVINDLDMSHLVNFLYRVSSPQELSQASLISAFLIDHPFRERYEKHSDDTLKEELNIHTKLAKSTEVDSDINQHSLGVPTLDSLLSGGMGIING